MALDPKEVKFIIEAQNNSKQTLDDVSKSIKDLIQLTFEQEAASKKGAVGLDELKATVTQLEQAKTKLVSGASLVKQFEDTEVAAKRAAQAVENAKAKLDKYRSSDKGVNADGTESQKRTDELGRLEGLYQKAITNDERRAESTKRLAERIRELGVDEKNLAGVEAQLRQSAADTGLAIGAAQENIAKYTENKLKAAEATRKLAEEEKFQQQVQNSARSNKEGRVNQDWQAMLGKQDATNMANGLAQASQQFTTLARSAGEVTPRVRDLFTSLQAITEPSVAARQSLSGVEDETRRLAQVVASISGPFTNYREVLNDLKSTQTALMSQGAMIDQFKQQQQVVNQAAAAFVKARNEVKSYEQQLRAASAPNDQLTQGSRAAQAAMQATATVMQREITTARELKSSLEAVGISARDLATDEVRLTNTARSLTQTVIAAGSAYDQYKNSINRTKEAKDLFDSSGRTSLGLFQRIRGEVLGLAASYIGLQGAISGVKNIIETTIDKQAIENKLGVIVGSDPKKIVAEFQYIHDQAVRLGVGLKEFGKGYSDFSMATNRTNINPENTKYIVERMTEAMRVSHMTSTAMDGVFYQSSQMIAKGKINAEDMRQIMNHFPAMRQLMADGLADIGYKGITAKNAVGDMTNAMKKGAIDAGVAYYAMAKNIEKVYKDQLPAALRSMQAEQDRLSTAMFDFKVKVSDAGFGKAYTDFLRHLQELMNQDGTGSFAEKLSSALVKVLNLLTFVVDHIEGIGQVLTVVFVTKAGFALAEFGSQLIATNAKLLTMSASLEAGTGLMGSLKRITTGVLGVIAAGFTGYEIGTYFYENFEWARKAGVAITYSILGWAELIKGVYKTLAEGISGYFKNMVADTSNAMLDLSMKAINVVRSINSTLGRTEAVGQADTAIALLQSKRMGKVDTLGNMESEWAGMRDKMRTLSGYFKDAWDQTKIDPKASAPGEKEGKKVSKETTGAGDTPKTKPLSTEGAEKKYARELESIQELLNNLAASAEKKSADTLQAKWDAIDGQYKNIRDRIAKLHDKDKANYTAQLDASIQTLKDNATKAYADDLEKERKKIEEAIDKHAVKGAIGFDERVKAKVTQIEDRYKELKAVIDKYEKDLKGDRPGADHSKEFAKIAADRVALQANEKGEISLVRRQVAEEQAALAMKRVNEALETRKKMLDEIKSLEDDPTGDGITKAQGAEMRASVIAEMQPRIQQLTNEARELANAMGDAFDPIQLQLFIAKLNAADVSWKRQKESIYSVKQANEDLTKIASGTMRALTDGLGKAIVGAGSLSGAFRNAGKAFLQFAADFLMKIGEMIMQQQILKALGGTSGGLGGWISGAVSGLSGGIGGSGGGLGSVAMSAASVFHAGGVVGGNGLSRAVNPSWFTNAPRYHSGGIAGLQPSEVPTVLEKGEEILRRDNPRNILNGGGLSGGSAQRQPDIKIVNAIDGGAMVQEGLSSTHGQKAIMNFMHQNRSQLRTILGS